MKNKFEALQILQDEEVNTQWEKVREIITGTCREVIGKKKPYVQKEWISNTTRQLIEERRELKAKLNNCRTRAEKIKAQEEYSNKNTIVKRNVKNDKRSYYDSLATEAEQAASKGNMKEVFDTCKKISGKFKTASRPIMDKEGKTLTTEEDQAKRWAEHFRELLNRPAPTQQYDILPADVDLAVEDKEPSKEEIIKAIKLLKNRKAAGPDEIPAEALKEDPTITAELLHPLFTNIWRNGKIPEEWKTEVGRNFVNFDKNLNF